MIKVAAKRVSLIHLNLESVSYEPVPDLKFVDLSRWDQHWDGDGALPTELPSGGTETLSAWMQITQNLAHAGTTSVQGPSSPAREEVPRSSRNRPVAALLLSPQPQTGQLQLLASAVNQNARNRTLHAEVNLIQNLYRRTGHLIPPHSYVLSSLKPCRMCAALIWQSAERIETLQILYGENDPGPHAQNTTLDPHTLDRKLASATPAQEALEIQRLLEDPSPKI
jgi:tRNA(Arg) A34 adenosine deaminase TadA